MTNTVLSTIAIDSLVEQIAKRVASVISNQPKEESEKIFGIEGAQSVTGLSRQTIYNKVASRQIPHSRKNGRLYFSSKELTDWLKSGKRQTAEEIKQTAAKYTKKGGI